MLLIVFFESLALQRLLLAKHQPQHKYNEVRSSYGDILLSIADFRIAGKKIKKSTGLTLALLIYVSATAAYFLPRNTEISDTEKLSLIHIFGFNARARNSAKASWSISGARSSFSNISIFWIS